MRVEIGNVIPHEVIAGQARRLAHGQPAVLYVRLPDDLTCTPGANVAEMMRHLMLNPVVTHLPDQEMFVAFFHGQSGLWSQHGTDGEWVHCESAAFPDKAVELERQLAEALGCARGRPDDLEDRYHTRSGPPGVRPVDAEPEPPDEGELRKRAGAGDPEPADERGEKELGL